MSHLATFEDNLRSLLFAETEHYFPELDQRRQNVYRKLVRHNLYDVIRRAIPATRKIAGDTLVDIWISRWLAAQGPQTKLLREVPLQFAAWMQEQPISEMPHPSFAEMIHWEALDLDVLHARDRNDFENQLAHAQESYFTTEAPQGFDGILVVDPSARLAAYTHAIRNTVESILAEQDPQNIKNLAWPQPLDNPEIMLLYRRDDRVWSAALSGIFANLLMLSAENISWQASLQQLQISNNDAARVWIDAQNFYKNGAIVGLASLE